LCKKKYLFAPMNKQKSSWLFAIIGLLIGLFFMYKGLTKHWLKPCKSYGPDTTIPVDYIMLIGILCKSQYFKMIGLFQILGGLLLVIPKTRLLGVIALLPIVFVIFTLHLFLDNRPEELVETGVPLLGLVLVLWYEVKKRVGWAALVN